MPPGFIGLSLEYPALSDYLGRDPSALNPAFLALVRAISPGQSPVLRIGGNSTDASWWPIPGVIPPAGVSYELTPAWLAVAHAMAVRLDARMILGINLAADNPALAGAEARALVAGIGRRYIDALEIGNEADVYTEFAWYRSRAGQMVFARSRRYDMLDYIEQFSQWRAALPRVPLAGPAFAQANWMGQLGSLLSAGRRLAVVTFHRYPLRACETDPTLGDFASVPNLMSDAAAAGMAAQVAPYVAVAHADRLPFRLDELNSASCKGAPGVSDTFSSALWVLDTLFNLASVGVDGVNIHTLPGAPYQPFSFTTVGSRWRATVHPLYYGLLMFAQAFPPGARLLSVAAPTGPVKAWATLAPDGRTRVVLINKDPSDPVVVTVQLPQDSRPLTVERLSAPGLSATADVRLGGESFGTETATGTLPLVRRAQQLTATPDGYEVALPAASAVLLTS
jgi:hypothetical protein